MIISHISQISSSYSELDALVLWNTRGEASDWTFGYLHWFIATFKYQCWCIFGVIVIKSLKCSKYQMHVSWKIYSILQFSKTVDYPKSVLGINNCFIFIVDLISNQFQTRKNRFCCDILLYRVALPRIFYTRSNYWYLWVTSFNTYSR